MLTFSKSEYGLYKVMVNGSNANGTTQTITWNITVELKIIDDLGNKINISKKPERIVSLAPSNTEILFAIGAGSNVVGRSRYCDYPPEVLSIQDVGGPTYGINEELIINLTPDLILASSITPVDVIESLRSKCNCTVAGFKATNLEDILNHITLFGKITKNEKNASQVVSDMQAIIDDITSKTSALDDNMKTRAIYIVWYPDLWTAGKGTYADDIIKKAGGINIAGDGSGWYIISREIVLTRDPEVILCSSMMAGKCDEIVSDPVLRKTSAGMNNKIYKVEASWIERPGPRIVLGLKKFYEYLKISVVNKSNPVIKLTQNNITTSKFQEVPWLTVDVMGAKNTSANIIAEQITLKNITPPVNSVGKYVNISTNLTGGWGGSMTHAYIYIHYTDDEIKGFKEESLKIVKYNGIDWEKVDSDVNTISNYVRGKVYSFSMFGITGEPKHVGGRTRYVYITPTPTPTPTPSPPISTPTPAVEEVKLTQTPTPVQTPQPTTPARGIPSIPLWYSVIAVIIAAL